VTSLGAPKRPAGCPASLALDELAAGDLAGRPEEADLRAHVDQCALCQDRMSSRAADPVLVPDRQVLGPLLIAELGRARARRRRLTLTAALGGVAAAAGLVLWIAGGRGARDDGGDRTKGALALTVHVRRAAGQIEAIDGQGSLAAGEEMRFALATAHAGYAAVLGLDAAPSVTVYAPAGGADAAPARVTPPGPILLDGSVVADGTAGFERVVAVLCDDATPVQVLRQRAQAALARAGGRPEAVSSLGTGCLESSVLLHKATP